ncbi:PAS domain S-box protein [Sphingomonas floccifaciens]|uniref:histidine kinase n=1 Tax=Sphingomonas floccifaciens TaxID=1844115 RepID=A0ABW4NC52_9SPHN
MTDISDVEARRLETLARYDVMDTPREPAFDEVAALAAKLCDAPIAVVNLIGEGRQFFKAEVGLGVRETPLESSFCARAILEEEFLLVPDATQDSRFACNPLVVNEPHLRFYAGALLKTGEGLPIGTLCVLDTRPRQLTELQQDTLRVLARQVMAQLELRRALEERSRQLAVAEAIEHDLRQAQSDLAESEARFRIMADGTSVMMWVTDPQGHCIYLNRAWYEFTGQSEEEALGYGWLDATHPEDRPLAERAFVEANAAQRPFRVEYRLRRPDGAYRWAIDAATPRFGADGAYLGYVGSVVDIDERRGAEDELRRAKTLLEAVMEAVPGVVYAKDREGRMLAANRGTVDLVGKPLSEIIGRTDREFLDDPVQAEAVTANDLRVMKENRTEAIEEQVSFPDGRRATWLSTKAPFRDAQGTVVGLVGSSVDISDRKQAEERLRDSEAKFRLMADAVPQIVWITDAQGRIEFFNKQWADYVGAPDHPSTAAEVSRNYVHPDDDARTMAAFDEARSSGGVFQIEHRIRRADGVYRWFLVRADPFRDERTGEIVRWFGASVDIQDRKAAEQALLDLNDTLERRVEAAIADRDRTWNNARDLLLVVGTDGIFRAVNPAWSQILGWRSEDLVGRAYLDFIHPDDHPSSEGALATASAEDLPAYENRYRHRDGSFRWISWVAAPEGELIYASGRDVTSDKVRQEQLEQAQEQLRQAQKMEAVGQLTGGIAHDFNNLLTGVIGSLDIMQRQIAKGDTSRMERYTTTAITAANRAAALTHRLLAFSRRQPLDPKPVGANRLVTGMEELLRRTIGEAVRLEIVTAGGLWNTLCDPHQLESAILNLAINARDAMPEGGTLTIETCNAHLDDAYAARQREVKPGQYVCICVTDTGVGMTTDIVAKAFEPFFTTKPIGQGTGLGLSMIYGFARQSEGYAKIYSEVGKGTTFKLYLPRHYGEGEEEEGQTVELGDEHRAERGEVVLVVEDETAVRALVVDVLEELGYRAIEAVDGPSGLKVLQSKRRIDLLVTDIGLPGLNGRQLADAARERRPELKVLFMTGYAENATIANGFLEPGMSMMTKPFAIDALVTRIRSIIEAT